jgi:aryl-alcohol dehydrogenase-like predicted oxidoreductase
MWELADEGLVREVGCTNLDADQLRSALDAASSAGRTGFISNQVEYSLLHRDPQRNGLRDLSLANNVALLPFYPLSSGLLTGKVTRERPPEGRLQMDRYQHYLVDANFHISDRIRPFAEERGLSMVDVALGWLLAQPDVPAVTPGATSPNQVRSNAHAAAWQPSAEDLGSLDGFTSA